MYNCLLYSFFFKNLINKIRRYQKKSLIFFFKGFYFLKFIRVKFNLFFFLILLKLKPIFNVYRIKPQKKKKIKKIKKRVFFKPKFIEKPFQSFKVSVTWFLIPFFLSFKQINFLFSFHLFLNCFFFFLDFSKFNLALYKKKKVYFKCVYFKKFFRLKKI